MPIFISMWNQISLAKELSMYSTRVHFNQKPGLNEWEVKYCPWWIDFKDGTYPHSESKQYELPEKGRLVVDDSADDSHATQMAKVSTVVAAPEKPSLVPSKKRRKRFDNEVQKDEEDGIVLDLLVGIGNSIPAAHKPNVHLFGMDKDEQCVAWLKEKRESMTKSMIKI
ncbi:hypothetical protein O6H91_16G014700 [Diphasiastrum complanatum]|uniref:Uncharacterized protein n=1 Tax=Diphasiastrum complanatum TaxID=34168 RepID=A0ACC2BA60_DIPCM|nr:hypothetical protein O6H91_16G014700 [Diphasiastrum complanatum]